jgi:hypothetical protein
MSSANITIQLQNESVTGSAAPWVHLEQPMVNSSRLTMDDFDRMLALVMAGNSAHQYMQPDCPATITETEITTALVFFSWPSSPDLRYTINTDLAAKNAPTSLKMDQEFDAVAEMATECILPFYMEGVTVWWQTPCYNRLGEAVTPAEIVHDGNALKFSSEVFGVLRVIGTAVGQRHTHTLTMPKSASTKVTDVKAIVTAIWETSPDSEGSEELELDIPDCVSNLLEVCPDTGENLYAKALKQAAGHDKEIFFSTCDGSVLEVRDVK